MKNFIIIFILIITSLTSFGQSKEFPWSTGPNPRPANFSTPFGEEVSSQVLIKLKEGKRLADRHRDYCGTGLEYRNGKVFYSEVDDGELSTVLQEFSENEFLEWFAAQSDESLSRADASYEFLRYNQTITRKRIQQFLQ